MARFPGEAGDARDAAPSPGLPRGTRSDLSTTPREARRASRARPHGRTDESPGSRAAPPPAIPPLAAPPPASPPLTVVALALADAFLAADEWSPAALERAGLTALGEERAFVGLAVRAALEAYPRPPRDAPRELAAIVGGSSRLVALFAARADRRPVRIATWTVEPVQARPAATRSRLVVDTVAELASALGVTTGRLLWLADTRGWNRRAGSASPLHHYGYAWIERPGRTPRLIEKPLPLLKSLQRTVLDELLVELPLHDAAHGFVGGRSAITGAARHTGREVVVTADLASFFATVRAPRVYGVFRRAGFAEPLAHLLTGLCTHRVSTGVLAAMPPGGSPDERFALRQALATAHLPQGSPSSPALANLSLRHLDARLEGLARSTESTYTRYADDLTFSGDSGLGSRVPAVVRAIESIVVDEGLVLNTRKTHVRRAGVRQSVTGIVVNEHTATGRREFDALKAILHNCARSGPADQNRGGHPDFRAHLLGRIGWVEQCHPARGARLRAAFDRIAWP